MSLGGEKISNRWEAVDEREFSEENEDIEEWANKNIESKEQQLEKMY